MPCRDYDYESSNDYVSLRAMNDKLARIACKALTHIEESGDGLEILILKDPEIADWWPKHKEADRKERERKEADREKLRKKLEAIENKKRALASAKAKLTSEELKALGIK